MNRLKTVFDRLKIERDGGFIPFVTAGDPDLATSLEIICALDDLGADVIEIGVPFSDPMADGPTIQRSSQRSLENGTNLNQVLELAANVRAKTEIPLVLFSYLNPLLRYGIDKLRNDAAGVDGILITDAVDEEAAKIAQTFNERGIDLISLIAPTTTDERIQKIASASSGFIYAVSRAGVTGAQKETSDAAEILVNRARRFTDLPIAVGFGISTREQIEDVWQFADAAVVGSAIVAVIEKSDPADVVENVRQFVSGLLPQFAKTRFET